MGNITATIKSRDYITASIKSTDSISGNISSRGNIVATVDDSLSDFDMYDGQYTVIPKIQSQILTTKFKNMDNDVVVESIPYQEVGNPSGGKTATIGGY